MVAAAGAGIAARIAGTAGRTAPARAAASEIPASVRASRVAANAPTSSGPVGATTKAGARGKAPMRKGGGTRKTAAASAAGSFVGSAASGVKDRGDSYREVKSTARKAERETDFITGQLKKSAVGKALNRPYPGIRQSPARRVLLAEFAVCIIIVATSPITTRHRDEKPQSLMKRFTAVMLVFLVLSLIASGGRGASRAAAGFGGLVTLALLVSNRDLFVVIARKFSTTADEADPLGPGPNLDEEGNPIIPDIGHGSFGR